MDFSVFRLEEIENRVASLERLFNVEAGATAADDALPPRFAETPIVVAGEEKMVSEQAQERMRRDYYSVRGWDSEGRPTRALLEDLAIAPRAGRAS
jgi:aldehyde:ferredoxin oxidoreductase